MAHMLTDAPIFPRWDETHSQVWGNVPVKIDHSLHQSPLFSMDAIADLIERYPRDRYALVETGGRNNRRLWREGDIGDLSGREVIDAISGGRMWMNLRDLSDINPAYKQVVDAIFDELSARMPGFSAPRRGCGLLISSPGAQVYYHADLPGQCLWQIVGRKRVFVYPSAAPFITPRQLEDIALFDMELDVPYADWYERHAQVHELNPGEMLNWPLNAPHRVQNDDCLNVSMTISYSTEEIRRLQILNMANGILRHRFGVASPSRRIEGVGFQAKRVMQRLLRDASWIRTARAERRPITFTLERAETGAVLAERVTTAKAA